MSVCTPAVETSSAVSMLSWREMVDTVTAASPDSASTLAQCREWPFLATFALCLVLPRSARLILFACHLTVLGLDGLTWSDLASQLWSMDMVGVLLMTYVCAFVAELVLAVEKLLCTKLLRVARSVWGKLSAIPDAVGERGSGWWWRWVLTPLTLPAQWVDAFLSVVHIEMPLVSPQSESSVVRFKEVPAEDERARLEMSNRSYPPKPEVALAPCMVHILDGNGMHIGFASLVTDPEFGFNEPMLVTVWHALFDARSATGMISLSRGTKSTDFFKPVVLRLVRGLDQVWFAPPAKLACSLGVATYKLGPFNPTKQCQVFSPAVVGGGGTVSSSASMGTRGARAFSLEYPLSTIAGSSGSPVLQGKVVVGVHTHGRRVSGKVVNGGTAFLRCVRKESPTSSDSSVVSWDAEVSDPEYRLRVLEFGENAMIEEYAIRGRSIAALEPELRGPAWADDSLWEQVDEVEIDHFDRSVFRKESARGSLTLSQSGPESRKDGEVARGEIPVANDPTVGEVALGKTPVANASDVVGGVAPVFPVANASQPVDEVARARAPAQDFRRPEPNSPAPGAIGGVATALAEVMQARRAAEALEMEIKRKVQAELANSPQMSRAVFQSLERMVVEKVREEVAKAMAELLPPQPDVTQKESQMTAPSPVGGEDRVPTSARSRPASASQPQSSNTAAGSASPVPAKAAPKRSSKAPTPESKTSASMATKETSPQAASGKPKKKKKPKKSPLETAVRQSLMDALNRMTMTELARCSESEHFTSKLSPPPPVKSSLAPSEGGPPV